MYIIAVIGVNFFDIAKKYDISLFDACKLMIVDAKKNGAHAVKFQAYKADTLASKHSPAYWDTTLEPTTNQHELFKKHDCFEQKDFENIATFCNKTNIDFICTPFDLASVDYLDNIDIYKDRIKMFHVKDAEFNPTGRQGVYSGYQPWLDRAGRFRSLGDGQVDFRAVFSKMAANDFDGWAVVEWECCLKHPEDGAREGAQFVSEHIIRVTERAFDDFANGGTDEAANCKLLGID